LLVIAIGIEHERLSGRSRAPSVIGHSVLPGYRRQEIAGAGKARPHRLCAEVFEFCTGDAPKVADGGADRPAAIHGTSMSAECYPKPLAVPVSDEVDIIEVFNECALVYLKYRGDSRNLFWVDGSCKTEVS
jgi:hypothetical protein